ncbi:hypothetical protein [Salinisphaera orenii]|nr:hypothetical protein [Salinisphaera halophila]
MANGNVTSGLCRKNETAMILALLLPPELGVGMDTNAVKSRMETLRERLSDLRGYL